MAGDRRGLALRRRWLSRAGCAGPLHYCGLICGAMWGNGAGLPNGLAAESAPLASLTTGEENGRLHCFYFHIFYSEIKMIQYCQKRNSVSIYQKRNYPTDSTSTTIELYQNGISKIKGIQHDTSNIIGSISYAGNNNYHT